MTKCPESTASFIVTPFNPPASTEKQVRAGFTDRATFRISPHGNTKEDAKPMTAANKVDTTITGRVPSLAYPIKLTSEESSSTKVAVAEGDSSKTSTGVCSFCSAMSPRPCLIHKAHAARSMGPNGELCQKFSEALPMAQEREYICRSRNHKPTLGQRVRLAHRASDVHKMKNSCPLNITTQAVLDEDMFEESCSTDAPQYHAQAPAQALEMVQGKVRTILNKIHTTPIKAGLTKSEEVPPRNSSSSSESTGRSTPNSIDEPSMQPDRCSSMLTRANTGRFLSPNEAAQGAMLALDLCNPLPKFSVPTRYSSTHGEEKAVPIVSNSKNHITEENKVTRIGRKTFDRISINERFDALATHLALLRSDKVCTKQASVLMTARSLHEEVNWLWDDLKEQLGEKVMSKRPEMRENIASEDNRDFAQKSDESTSQKQQRLENELLTLLASDYNSWTQLRDKLIDMKARQKEEVKNLIRSTGPKNESKAKETTSDRKQREELAKGIGVWKELNLKQHATDHRETRNSSPTKLSSSGLDKEITIMTSGGANLAKSTAESMVKNAVDAQKVEGHGMVEDQQKILDDEIALLKKKKVRQELEREVARNEARAAEVLRQKRQSEQMQKKWDDECEAKDLKTKPKITSETDEHFCDFWDDIDWEAVFGVAAFIVLGIPFGCTGAMIVWHIFITIFRRVFSG